MKISKKIRSEPDFAFGTTFPTFWLTFFRFLVHFGGFRKAWGGLWAAFLEFSGLQKRKQNFIGFLRAFFGTPARFRRVTRSLSEA